MVSGPLASRLGSHANLSGRSVEGARSQGQPRGFNSPGMVCDIIAVGGVFVV